MFPSSWASQSVAQKRQQTPTHLPRQIPTHLTQARLIIEVREIRDTRALEFPTSAEWQSRDCMMVQLWNGWAWRALPLKLLQPHQWECDTSSYGAATIAMAVPESGTHTTMLDPTRHGRRVSNTDIWLFQEVDQIEFAIDNVSSSLPLESRTFMSCPTMLCLQSARQFVEAPTMAASCEQEQHFLDCKSYLVAHKRNDNNALVHQTGKTS